MFDIGWSELLIIGVVALIAIGPKELPGVLRMLGQWITKLRRMASEFQGQFQEAMREAEMADIKKEFDAIKDSASGLSSLTDPLDYTPASKEKDDAQGMVGASETPKTEDSVTSSNEGVSPGEPQHPVSEPAVESNPADGTDQSGASETKPQAEGGRAA